MLKKVSAFLAASLLLSSTAFASWTVDGLVYENRDKITIDNANVGATLTDFPVLVKFSANATIGANSNADGFDHRFTTSDGTTLCKYERESFSITGGEATGIYWVKVPSVSTSSDTDIYMYYSSTDIADGQDAANVWDANFKAVWHGASLTDSTTATTLTESGTTAYNQASGKVNKCFTFNGSNGYKYAADGGATDISGANQSITMMCWAYRDANFVDGTQRTPISKWVSATPDRQYMVQVRNRSTDSPVSSHSNATMVDATGSDGNGIAIGGSSLPLNDWAYIGGVYNDTDIRTYFNGLLETAAGTNASPDSYTAGIYNGAAQFMLGQNGSANYWSGKLCEVRISNSARSAEHIKFEYYNMSSATNELTFTSETSTATATGNMFLVF